MYRGKVIGGRLTLALMTLLFLASPAVAGEWRLTKEFQGVQIFSRYPPGAAYKEFYGEVEINAKPDRIVRLLQDLEAISEWHYRTEKAEVLDLIDQTNAIVHIFNRPPWPIRPRDVVCKVSLTLDKENKLIRITINSIGGLLPEEAPYIRTASLKAEWQIKSFTDTTSFLRYQIYVEPGGEIPRWLFNAFAVDVPLRTLLNLKGKFSLDRR